MPSRPADRSSLEHLPPPPRRVPASLRLRLAIGGPFAGFAWLYLGIGLSIALVFLRAADLSSGWRLRAPERASGVVVSCGRTGASTNGTTIFANRYRFDGPAGPLAGVSYATGVCLRPGAAVTVEYAPEDPAVSRVVGMRRAEFGAGVSFVAVFPLIGLVLAAISAGLGLRTIRYLARGELTHGKLVGKAPTRLTVNDRPQLRMQFEISPRGGFPRTVAVKTLQPEELEDDSLEPLLYDPARPDVALAWDTLPEAVSLDPSGSFRPVPWLRTLLVLAPLAIGLAANLAFPL